MKYLKYLLILLFIPFLVLAEECDVSNITITSMKPNKIEGNTEVISEPTFEDRTIKLNLKMYDVGDSISYDMTIKNDSEEDYMIDEDTFKTNSNYIEYTLKTKDNTNVVKGNSTKEVSLIVTYKKEVEDDKLTNNKFNASNTLKLSLNTSEKEQPLDIITTDNIKESLDPQEVKNPITSVSSMLLISTILLTTILIIYILIKRKNKYTKYLLIVLSMILIPTVYAICTCDIEVESTIEIEKNQKLFDTVVGLSKVDNACVTKYEGEVTDEVGKTVAATNVYYDKCVDKRNVIFGGFCWQVIRTTETGGTKVIYNGEAVDGKCESTRERHIGYEGDSDLQTNMSGEYLYGSSITIDKETKSFVLNDTFSEEWSESTFDRLIGKFTCKNSTGKCKAVYSISAKYSNQNAYALKIHYGNVSYDVIGNNAYNHYGLSPAMVGYMFNNVYEVQKYNTYRSPTHKLSSAFTYDSETGKYTLSGITKNVDLYRKYNQISDTHYTCWNETGECDTISYIYQTDNNSVDYINITNGKSITDALDDMLSNNDVNKYNSTMKGIIDSWYAQNLSTKTDMLEDTVYCNNRTIADLGSWNPNGGDYTSNLLFTDYYGSNNISCLRETDQFSLTNNKAQLTYPIGLLTSGEYYNLRMPQETNELPSSEYYYWSMSPKYFSIDSFAFLNSDYSNWSLDNRIGVQSNTGVRPAISLKSSLQIVSGTGSETDPWVIKE